MRSKRSTPVRCLRGQPDAPPGAQASRPHPFPAAPVDPPGRRRLCQGGRRAEAPFRVDRAGEWGRAAPGPGRAGRPRSRGGAPPINLAPQGRASGLAGPQPCRCGRAVTLGGPSSFFVSLRGQLFFRLFQASAGPPTAPRHFNPSSRAALFQKMSSTWVSLRRSDQQAHLSERRCSRPVSTGLSC